MVFAVRCPNPQCKKFMLVEDDQRGQTVPCLICKLPIAVPAPPPPPIDDTIYTGPPTRTRR
jgi:hypothetical protein